MSDFDDRVRAARARQITEDPVYIDAVEAAKRFIHLDLATMDVTDERSPQIALIHVIRLQALEESVRRLQSIMITGEGA